VNQNPTQKDQQSGRINDPLPAELGLIDQNLSAGQPGMRWCDDVTYLRTLEGGSPMAMNNGRTLRQGLRPRAILPHGDGINHA
jgi:hypothetical protein